MAATKEKAREAALAIANRVRERLGMQPVDHLYSGVPGDAWACPITNTVIDDDLDTAKWAVITRGERIVVFDRESSTRFLTEKHAGGSQAFIHYFDNGSYSDLVSGDKKQEKDWDLDI